MAYCKKCGLSLDEDALFCPACGTPVVKTKKTRAPAEKTSPANDSGGTLLNVNKIYGHIDLQHLPKGHVIDDRYRIIRKLGQGSFGAVYLAWDEELETNKALKIIPEALSNDHEAMRSLRKEASIMIKLNHKNIVRVYDFHHHSEIKYIDMEYVEGQSLAELKLAQPDNKFTEEKVKQYALQIAEGLAYAHNKKVIHKDIKPQNILLTKEGVVKLMDFGIAETVHSSMSRLKNTGSSGTLVYMSPEQLRGKDVGREADIYSLGATLYELLSGHPPFYQGDITYQIINEKPEPLAGVSQRMNTIILKCLEKEREKRFSDAGTLIKALQTKETPAAATPQGDTKAETQKEIRKETKTPPPQVSVPPATGNGNNRKRLLLYGIPAIVVVLLLVFFFLYHRAVPVTITSVPSGARLQVDGEYKGETPLTIPLSFDTHRFKLQAEKYKDFETTRTITHTTNNIKFSLKPVVYPATYTSKVAGIEMVFVKGGTFKMGCTGEQSDCGDDEKPVHTVTMDDFYMGKYEVTVARFKKFIDATGYETDAEKNGYSWIWDGEWKKKNGVDWRCDVKGNRRNSSTYNNPVINVSWNDAVAFCKWLSKETGQHYRLPTEAEWEYAARGGNRSSGYKYAGSNNIDQVAWYWENSGKKTHPVGQKKPNELGIYDMSGNVWEWCSDWYGKNYYGSSPQNNPQGPSSGSYRVARGGSWSYYARDCRVAYRYGLSPGFRIIYLGFRLVLVP